MKFILVSLMLTASFAHTFSQACCCTSAGGSYSILPNLDKHVVGLRYSYGEYNSTTYAMTSMNMNGMDMSNMGPGKPTLETMHTIDAFGRFNLPRRFQLSVFVPVHLLTESTEGSFQRAAGLGDISLLLQYAIINPQKCTGKPSKHQLRLGAGVKAPTGQFKMTPDGMFTTDLQMGSGSFDFLFNAVYTYRYKRFGSNVLASYKKNLDNKESFRFGDKLKGGLNAFYVFTPAKALAITPLAGISLDHAFYNIYQKQLLNYTGGTYISATAGLDIMFKNFILSSSMSPMLANILHWSGEPKQVLSFETGLYYSF